MIKYSLKEDLRSEAGALKDAFRLGRIKVARRLPGAVRDGHFGFFCSLAKLDDMGEIQLWFDRASGHAEPLFWLGINYETEAGLDNAIGRASLNARPKLTLTSEDMQEVAEGGLMPKEPLPLKMMNSTIAERLNHDRYKPDFYLGRYFFDYSTESAVAYLQALLGENIEDEGFWEGEVTQRMATFYERNVEARKACISKYGCTCVVCNLNFLEKYGRIGIGFIHVHHVNPLAAGAEKRLTKVSELVPVCPNCHAMLHRGSLKTPETLRMMMAQAENGDRRPMRDTNLISFPLVSPSGPKGRQSQPRAGLNGARRVKMSLTREGGDFNQ